MLEGGVIGQGNGPALGVRGAVFVFGLYILGRDSVYCGRGAARTRSAVLVLGYYLRVATVGCTLTAKRR
jgi:hypothetical protein